MRASAKSVALANLILYACDNAPTGLGGRVVRRDGTPVPAAAVRLGEAVAVTSRLGTFTLTSHVGGAQVLEVAVPGERSHAVPIYADGTAKVVEIPLAPRLGSADLWFGGDVMFARRFEDKDSDGHLGDGLIVPGDRGAGATRVLEPIAKLLQDADLAIVNLETTVSDCGSVHPTKPYTLRSEASALTSLARAGVDVAGMANNHVYDYLEEGTERMLELVRQSGLLPVGAGTHWDEAVTPLVTDTNGTRIALIAGTSITGRLVSGRGEEDASEPVPSPPYYTADPPEETGGVAKAGAMRLTLDNLEEALRRAQGADLQVLVVHGGTQYSTDASEAIRRYAHFAIDRGVDLVVGHHPHVIQGVEVYRGVAILYSIGNLVFDQKFVETLPALVVEAHAQGGRIEEVAVRPIWLDHYVPKALAGSAATAILRRVSALSAQLGATVRIHDASGRGVIELAPGPPPVTRTLTVEASLAPSLGARAFRSEPMAVAAAQDGAWFVTGAEDADGLWVDLGEDLLVNGGFEDGLADDQTHAPGWEVIGKEKSTASGFLRLTRTRKSDIPSTTSSQGRIALEGGRRLSLVGRWRADADAGPAVARLALFADRETESEPLAIAETRARPEGDWQPFRVDVMVPRLAPYAKAQLIHEPGARSEAFVDFDDVSLIAWTGAVPAPSVSSLAANATHIAVEADDGASRRLTLQLSTVPVQP